jgi:hypothetical protein
MMTNHFEVVVIAVCFGALLSIVIVLLTTGGTP